MQERRRVLFGTDLIQDLVIEKTFYRAQVEMELRAKLLRLRQKAADVLFEQARAAAADDRFGTEFPGAGAARAAGFGDAVGMAQARDRQASARYRRGRNAVRYSARPAGPKQASRDVDPEALFASYLKQIEALVGHVDRLEK